MTSARDDQGNGPDMVPELPAWVSLGPAGTLEDVAFLSGAALSCLHAMLGHHAVPHALLRDRLALRSAEACVGFSGRPERAADLRDAVHLLRPGDLPGPAGETCLAWRRAVERPLSAKALYRALPDLQAERIAIWRDAAQGAPVSRAARVLEAVLTSAPRAELPALVLADARLAQTLGWDHVVPLLAAGLRRADLSKQGAALRMAAHRALISSVAAAVRLAAELARRAAHLGVG